MDRDVASTTANVADLIDALAFPVIEPLATHMEGLADLPALPEPRAQASGVSRPGGTSPDSPPSGGRATRGQDTPSRQVESQLDGVRELMDACGDAVAALRRHQNKSAALIAVMIERLEAAAVLEGGLLNLDSWQRGCSVDQVCAELAVILHVSEGAARRFVEQSVDIVRQLPETMALMSSGALGWDHAVVIAEETSLLRGAGLPQEAVDAFERRLLVQAERRTLGSFRSTARRMRERSHPETITPRTKRAYADRNLRVNRGQDGMSWMSLYAPAPTIEAIWDQCTYTAQAARGPHEARTVTQLRADIASALLLGQSLGQNGIHAPAPDPARGEGPDGALKQVPGVGSDHVPAPEPNAKTAAAQALSGPVQGVSGNGAGDVQAAEPVQPSAASAAPETGPGPSGVSIPAPDKLPAAPEPLPYGEGDYPDPKRYGTAFYPWQLPLFEDPNYRDPSFSEPDPRNEPDWHPTAQLPMISPAGTAVRGASFGPADPSATGEAGSPGEAGQAIQSGPMTAAGEPWPTLPHILPVVLIPALSMLGHTNEPAWMEGVGPMSMEVAKHLAAQSPSFLRVLVDPIANTPLDIAPERYRVTQAMRTMLRIRDEYCQFPGCMAKAVNCDVDHIKRFETGGLSIYNNLECLCAHHHILKHYKDDKDRYGRPRCLAEPERQTLAMRGWTPTMEESGRISWTSPSGRYCPPEPQELQPPAYPEWMRTYIDGVLTQQGGTPTAQMPRNPEMPDEVADGGRDGDCAGLGGGNRDAGQSGPLVPEIASRLAELVNEGDCGWDEDAGNMPEPPAELTSDTEADEVLNQLAVEHALRHPYLGLAA